MVKPFLTKSHLTLKIIMDNIQITPDTTVKELTKQLQENLEIHNNPELRLTIVVDYSEDIAFLINDGRDAHLINQEGNEYSDIDDTYYFSTHDPKLMTALDLISTMSEKQKDKLKQALSDFE